MSRYIDAEWLKEKIGNTAFLKLDDTEVVEQFIDTAPSIDIVRCKECRWAEPTNDGWNSVACNFYGETTLTMPTDGFCSYGEREGE